MNYLANILKNNIFIFTISRYLGYGLRVIRSILIAKFLGPYFFGIWGFLNLIQRYLLYTSFGVPNAVTVELSTEGIVHQEKQKKIIGVASTFSVLVFVLLTVCGIGIQFFEIPLSEKYKLSQFTIILGIIIGLEHINQLYVNIYRVYKKLTRIIVGEQLIIIIPFAAIILYRGETLLTALLISFMLSRALAITIYTIKPPFILSFSFNISQLKELLSIGIPLLIKNLSFVLITLTAHTIISIYYSVEEMGYYSLALRISSTTLLGLNTVAWVIFPKILSKTSKNVPDEEVIATVRKINDLYSTSVFLFVYGVIIAMPVLFMLLPNYQPASPVLYILLLSQAIISVSFGYNSVAIARKKQLKVAQISIIAVIFVASLSLICALIKLHFSWIALSVLIGTFVYTFLQSRLGASLLHKGKIPPNYFQNMLPLGSLCAVLISLLFAFLGNTMIGGILGFTIFVITSRTKLIYLWNFMIKKITI